MASLHALPCREKVFIQSLQYHGFRRTHRRTNLKYACGYVITATRYEDSGGIDLWVKMPKDDRLLPVQVTQRGTRIYKQYHKFSDVEFDGFVKKSEKRICEKRRRCKKHGIAFVLARDFVGLTTNPCIAWGDIKALRYAIAHLNHWAELGKLIQKKRLLNRPGLP